MDRLERGLDMVGNLALSDRFLEQLAYNEKMAELGRLAAGVIHELNTPLSVIAAAAQLILREDGLSESVVELVERIGGEAQRLSQMSRGILSFSRQDGGGGDEADLNLVLSDVVQMLAYEIQKRSVTVNEHFDHDFPLLRIDAGRLKQVFINLIMNALQAMNSGGSLTLRTLQSDAGSCEVHIADTGYGIADNDIDQIFEPFFTTKGAGEGTGLGLFVTRQIIAAEGGEISVESRVGQGTCFIIRFPLRLS